MKQLQTANVANRRSKRLQPQLDALEVRLVLSTIDPSSGPGSPPVGSVQYGSGVGYSFTNWPVSALQQIELDAENTFPIVGPRGQGIRVDDWVIRDPFPVTNMDGSLARIGGWYVMAGLASPREAPSLEGMDYIISRDGVNWQQGGTILSTADVGGDQMFSGDLKYDEAQNKLYIFYTRVEGGPVGDEPTRLVTSPSGQHMRQEIAVAEASVVASANDLDLRLTVNHGVRLRPDGQWYAQPELANTETEVYGFRDPWLFQDPESGLTYMLYVGNWGSDQSVGVGSTGDAMFPNAGPMNVDPTLPRNDGVVGLAVATDATLTNWEMLPPIFGGIGVNEQIELPHFVYQDGKYYLFLDTHDRTFIGDLKYDFPEGLYGFVAEDLRGPYRPLNGDSLVLANPPEDPLQNYGWKVVPTANGEAMVVSFINKGNSSTISPAVKIRLEGDRAYLSGLQPSSPAEFGRDPGLPFAFGVSATRPDGSPPQGVIASIDATSDTGSSQSDGITNDSTPTINGSAPAGSIVRLMVSPQGTGGQIQAGQAIAGSDGRFTITSSELPDGDHTFRVVASQTAAGSPVVWTEPSRVLVDTQGPGVSRLQVDPRTGRLTLTVEDAGGGMDPSVLGNPTAFQFRALLPRRTVPLRVTGASVSSAATQPGNLFDLVLNTRGPFGPSLRAGRYALLAPNGPLSDLAGNSLAPYGSSFTVYPNRRVSEPQPYLSLDDSAASRVPVARQVSAAPARPLARLLAARARFRR